MASKYYVGKDGTIRPHGGDRYPRARHGSSNGKVQSWWSDLSWQIKVAVIAVLVMVIKRWIHPDPYKNGTVIPASQTHPNDHFQTILSYPTFTRRFSDTLGKNRDYKLETKYAAKSGNAKIVTGRVDFGGPDGHDAESGRDFGNIEGMRGTRCSTTQSAVTGYFCGAKVAENQNFALQNKRKPSFYSIESFMEYVDCQYRQGETKRREAQKKQTGTDANDDGTVGDSSSSSSSHYSMFHFHKRSVYRLSIGCKEPLAGFSHAFSIVAQPDGTFLWLQSFIQQYSLHTWMEGPKLLSDSNGVIDYDHNNNKVSNQQTKEQRTGDDERRDNLIVDDGEDSISDDDDDVTTDHQPTTTTTTTTKTTNTIYDDRYQPDTINSRAHLTYRELMSKLLQIQRLQLIGRWTDQANTDYDELFGVNMNVEKLTKGEKSMTNQWKPTYRLSYFAWDEACEYPLPSDVVIGSTNSTRFNSSTEEVVDNQQHQQTSEKETKSRTTSRSGSTTTTTTFVDEIIGDHHDECSALKWKFMMQDMKDQLAMDRLDI